VDIYAWNELLWNIVTERLFRRGSNLYLAFDESLLAEGANGLTGEPSDQVTVSELNRVLRSHCRPLSTGFVGLSRLPEGQPLRDNWDWIFERDERGRTLCLTFAAHQVLAAEMMQGVSFYAAYWDAFGVEPEENRINPFGDGGRTSFRELWEQLRSELLAELQLAPEQITFKYGSGPNKYRNLPISQSLLNERDLATLYKEITILEGIDDDTLYGRMTHVRLSPSGSRKVLGGALRNQLVRQFRDFASSSVVDTEVPEDSGPELPVNDNLGQLVLTEEQEIFGGEVVHITAPQSSTSAQEIIAGHFNDHDYLIFQREDYSAKALTMTVLPERASEIWILLPVARIAKFLALLTPSPCEDLLGEMFSVVRTSLPETFGIVHCHYLPASLEFVNIAVHPLIQTGSSLVNDIEVLFGGGICVHSGSNSYICGFGPTEVSVGSEVLQGSEECYLDYELTIVSEALAKLASVSYPRVHVLKLRGVQKRIQFVETLPPEDHTTCYFNNWCLLPPVCARGRHGEGLQDLDFLLSVFDLESFPQRTLVKGIIEQNLLSNDIQWVPVKEEQVTLFDVMLDYLDVPDGLRTLLRDRALHAHLLPATVVLNDVV